MKNSNDCFVVANIEDRRASVYQNQSRLGEKQRLAIKTHLSNFCHFPFRDTAPQVRRLKTLSYVDSGEG